MRLSRLLFAVFTFVFIVSAAAVSQVNPNEDQGLRPYDSLHGGEVVVRHRLVMGTRIDHGGIELLVAQEALNGGNAATACSRPLAA